MGLDGVELVLAIEERFKISISDSEASQSETVGKIVDLVYARLRHSTEEPCPSQHGFYRIRKELMTLSGISRSAVTPSTQLEDLIPKQEREQHWRQLIHALNGDHATFIELALPAPLHVLVFFVLPALAAASILKVVPLSYIWLGIFPAMLAMFIGRVMTMPFRTRFPAALSHVQDLIPFVKTLDCTVWSEEEVFQTIREITVEQLGVEPDVVSLESRWVADLGLDA